MPRRRTQSRAALVGIAVVVALVGGMVLLSWLGEQGTVEVQLGSRDAGPYDTEEIARQVARDGPFVLQDLSPDKRLDIYLQHEGEDPSEGWIAISARAPGVTDRDCALQWDGERFEDPCSGETYPADGTGLTRFPTRIEGDDLYIDFQQGTG